MFIDTTFQTRLTAHLSPPGAAADFWAPLGHGVWFGKDPAFDQRFRETFALQHGAAARGELMPWLATSKGALSLVILLDQYPRNAFRGTARMYATDPLARIVADAALKQGHDQAFAPELRLFFYIAFSHSEDLADQDRAVALVEPLGPDMSRRAASHRGIIARFGRFPHRSAILGRTPTAAETAWLADGGYAG